MLSHLLNREGRRWAGLATLAGALVVMVVMMALLFPEGFARVFVSIWGQFWVLIHGAGEMIEG